MADEKKPDKPADKPAEVKKDPFVDMVFTIGALLLVMMALNSFLSFINNGHFFDGGVSSFSPRGIILKHTRPINSLDNPLGVRVVSLNETTVYDSPGERKVGTQKFNTRGKILQGFVMVGGVKYWYVDYDSGPDGWVREDDIAYQVSEPNAFERMLMKIPSFVSVLKVISVLISLSVAAFMGYLIYKLTRIRENQRLLLYPVSETTPLALNPKWERVVAHIESQNEGDWRLAILEADILLSEVLDTLSLLGETVGDKLKSIEKSDLLTLSNAWEAHKVRNQIAHEGSDFILSQREARRVIELYKTVFEEFKII